MPEKHDDPASDPPEEQSEAVQKPSEERSVASAARLSARLIYEVIRRDGEAELGRPAISLIWSGLAAGILISFSVVAQAVLHAYLPEADWSILVESLGYSVGFMIVIFGRMQLFTENTITTVLPVVAGRLPGRVLRMLRLWGIVLGANILGTTLASFALSVPGVLPAEILESALAVSRHAVEGDAGANFLRAMPAGVVIAALVWLLPAVQSNSFFIILMLTWLIVVAGFAHVIAGSVEAGLLAWSGEITLADAVLRFFLPVLAGNVIGGTAIFTLTTWGQVKNEVVHEEDEPQTWPRSPRERR